jgi:hypothetical protein
MQIRIKKDFLSTVATTVVSALLVAGAVMGATTISENIVTEGTLTVTGITTLTGVLAANGGMTMTGTVTNGIDLTGATLTQAADNALFSIGSYSTPKTVVMTDNYLPFQVYIDTATNVSDKSLIGGYFKVANKTNDTAGIQLVGMASRVAMAKNALDAFGIQSHLNISASAASTGNMTAISGKTVIADSIATGIVSAGLFTVEGPHSAATPNNSYGVWADITEGAVVQSIFEGSVNSEHTSGAVQGLTLVGKITTGIDMSGITSTTTGINIGTATTGLALTGTYTTGISIPATATTGITSAAPIRVTTAATA